MERCLLKLLSWNWNGRRWNEIIRVAERSRTRIVEAATGAGVWWQAKSMSLPSGAVTQAAGTLKPALGSSHPLG